MSLMSQEASSHPLNSLVRVWVEKINQAKRQRWERFGQYGAEAMKFYDGAHDFMWQEEYALGQQGFLSKDGNGYLPRFRMSVNRLFEAVALFGPALYYRNPTVMVSLNQEPEFSPESLGFSQADEFGMQEFAAIMQQVELDKSVKTSHASIMEAYSNRIQYKTNKKAHARMAIVETILKGMSFLFTEIYSPPGSNFRIPRSTFVSCDDVGFDPDADYEENAQWCFRECVHPVNLVEREYGLPEGSLKGNMESLDSQSMGKVNKAEAVRRRKTGKSYDLLWYYKIYSKNGFGEKLKSTDKQSVKSQFDFSPFGDYCYLVVAPGVPFFLNMPSWDLGLPLEELVPRVSWPVPFWQDQMCSNGWPFSKLSFYEKPKSIYPVSLVKPCIGELRFVNWCMSFLADKVASSCQTIVAVAKAAGAEIQNQLQSGMAPFTVIEISDILGKNVNELVSFLQSPPFAMDIWRMVSEVNASIDKRTGLTELLYGITGAQIRSAAEAQIKDQNIAVRPDDMANSTEDWISESCMKEMEAARWILGGQDIAPVVGNLAGKVWDEQILTQDVDAIIRDFTFRIEAGSSRKPNKGSRVAQLKEIGAVIAPVLQQFAVSGNPGPWNAYVSQLGKAMEFDPSQFFVQPPEPPPMPEQQGPSPEEMAAQQKAEESNAKMDVQRHKLEMDHAKAMQQMEIDQDRHEQEMDQMRQKGRLEMDLKRILTKRATEVPR